MGAQLNPQRWTREHKLSYCKRLLEGMALGAETGDKLFPIYLTRLHVVACFKDAFAPDKDANGEILYGYGITPQELGAPADWTVAQALEYVEALWVSYVQAAWPLHRQTPGSEKYREAIAQGNPVESVANPWTR